MLRFNFAEIEESKYKQYIKVDLVFFIFVFLVVIFIVYYQSQNIERQISITNSKISQLNNEINRLKRLKTFEKELLKLRSDLKNKLNIVTTLERKRHVPRFLYFFERKQVIDGLWLDKLKYNRNTLYIEANALRLKSIPRFLREMDNELGTVKLQSIQRKSYENDKLKFKISYYKFKVNVRLNNGLAN